MPKRFKWTVEISVDKTWIADGFNLDADTAEDMVQRMLPYAYGHEVSARVLKAPDADAIAKEQGYKNAKDKRKRERA